MRARNVLSPGWTEKVQHRAQVRGRKHLSLLRPVDSGRKIESQFRLEQGLENQVHGTGSLSDYPQELWRDQYRILRFLPMKYCQPIP